MAMMDFTGEADAWKRLLQMPEVGVTEADYNPPAPAAPAPSEGLMMPQSPLEQVMEKNGKGKTLGKMALTALSGGLLAPVLMPELMGAGKRYEAEMDAYKEDLTAQRMSERLESIDFDNLKPEDIAFLNAASSDLGEFGTDMLAAQMTGGGGDQAIAEAYGYSPYQWSQLSPEAQRGMRNQYRHENGDAGYFDAQLAAQGKAPEQLQAGKSAELFGSAEGQQYGDDRKLITGVRGQVQAYDQGLDSLGSIKTMLENPENEDVAGWPRIIRDAINANTKEDGSMDAEMAAGVVDLISQATFGALSQSELDLLKGGLMDPTKSREYNLGTINTAMKRIENDRTLALDAARGAADRYSKWDGQDDYEKIFENDWLYQNVGAGSKIKPIPAFGNNPEYTFQQHVEDTMSSLGPFDPQPSRDELVNGFAAMRKEAEEMYNEMKRLEKENSVAAQQVRATLERPFPTVQQ